MNIFPLNLILGQAARDFAWLGGLKGTEACRGSRTDGSRGTLGSLGAVLCASLSPSSHCSALGFGECSALGKMKLTLNYFYLWLEFLMMHGLRSSTLVPMAPVQRTTPKCLHPGLHEKASSLCPRERLSFFLFFSLETHLRKKQQCSFFSAPPTWPRSECFASYSVPLLGGWNAAESAGPLGAEQGCGQLC